MKRLLIALVLLLPACSAPAPRADVPALLSTPEPVVVAQPQWRPFAESVSVRFDGEFAWALRGPDAVLRGGDLRTNTESMVKAWLAVDFVASQRSAVSVVDEETLSRMIRRSDDQAAQRLYLRLGSDASIRRMIATCGLTETTVHPNWWSKTTVSAMDAAKLGQCVENGPGISLEWRDKLLTMMRSVAPDNRFGIPQAPALRGKDLAIKNGWTEHSGVWTVTCLAVWDEWSLAVLTRFRGGPGEHLKGADVCATVADQLFRSQPR